MGNDIYVFTTGWGIDTILEAAAGGIDTLDFSLVTASLMFTVNGNVIVTSGLHSATHAADNVEKLFGGSAADTFNAKTGLRRPLRGPFHWR